MVKHKPWKFFNFEFKRGDKTHSVSVVADSREGAIFLLTEIYGNISSLREIPKQKIRNKMNEHN